MPGEIVPAEGFYDYEEKYLNDRAKLQIPAPLAEAEVAQVQETAVRAYAALRVEGMARVDFFYAGGRFLVNEVNTIPGLHAHLDVPQALGGERPGTGPPARPPGRDWPSSGTGAGRPTGSSASGR